MTSDRIRSIVGHRSINIIIPFEEGETGREQIQRIFADILPDFLELFDAKNREYGGESAFVLGERGQFADMWRKMAKLKRFLWDDNDGDAPQFESVEEILLDLMGHCALTIDMIRQAKPKPKGLVSIAINGEHAGTARLGERVAEYDEDDEDPL